jgi:hypothetical protein
MPVVDLGKKWTAKRRKRDGVPEEGDEYEDDKPEMATDEAEDDRMDIKQEEVEEKDSKPEVGFILFSP